VNTYDVDEEDKVTTTVCKKVTDFEEYFQRNQHGGKLLYDNNFYPLLNPKFELIKIVS
jgi:hypothetical protein